MKKYEEFINALQYVDQGDNKSAYDKLTELINDNLELENKTLYYDALYARASLDIANLNLHIDDSIEDLFPGRVITEQEHSRYSRTYFGQYKVKTGAEAIKKCQMKLLNMALKL